MTKKIVSRQGGGCVNSQYPIEIEESVSDQISSLVREINWTLVSSDFKQGNRWTVTVAFENGQSLMSEYTTGAAWFCIYRARKYRPAPFRITEADKEHLIPLTPSATGLFYSLAMDAMSVDSEPHFTGWAESLGYSTDSIQALESFTQCERIRRELIKGGFDLESLYESYHDY